MNPELTYTLELARALNRTIDGVSAMQERVGSDLAFDRSLKRGREGIISMLHKACKELAPIRDETLPDSGGEIAEFIRALEYGEIPAAKAAKRKVLSADALGPDLHRLKNGNSGSSKNLRKSAQSADELIPVPLVPGDKKSREVMSQWR